MLKNCRPIRHGAAVVLLFTLSLTAIGQQSQPSIPAPASAGAPASTQASAATPAAAPTRQMIKVMKSLSRYDEGTKLDIRLTDGSHQVGKLGETRSTNFVFVDSVSGQARTIDYLEVADVRATGKGTTARQLHKTFTGKSGFVIGTVVVLVVIAVIALVDFRK